VTDRGSAVTSASESGCRRGRGMGVRGGGGGGGMSLAQTRDARRESTSELHRRWHGDAEQGTTMVFCATSWTQGCTTMWLLAVVLVREARFTTVASCGTSMTRVAA
jgi:hypothetical protein